MQPIGIIANPASGKDIRRLVAYGSVFDNYEKVNIVRRVLLGLDAVGVREVYLMPDTFGIGVRALKDLELGLTAKFLDMEMKGVQEDTTTAARCFEALGAACLVTLGGDGTNRAAAKAEAGTPILPISTGTNNVFPYMLEGTLAGLAAGVLCVRPELKDSCVKRAPRLTIRKGEELLDMALVDVVVSKAGFVASRAIWDVSAMKEIFLARAEPGHIGFSAVGGHLKGFSLKNGQGLHIVVGEGGIKVKAPIAPGLVHWVPIKSYRAFLPGEGISIAKTPALVALDGERELVIKAGEEARVFLGMDGPLVVDVSAAIGQGKEKGLFEEPA